MRCLEAVAEIMVKVIRPHDLTCSLFVKTFPFPPRLHSLPKLEISGFEIYLNINIKLFAYLCLVSLTGHNKHS